MNRVIMSLAAACLASGMAAPSVRAQAPFSDFARYQVIIDKAPFGKPPPPPDPNATAAPPAPAGPAWTKDYRLTMLVEEADGAYRAGLVHNPTKKSYTFDLKGEAEDGIQFVEVDYENESATFSLNGDVQTITMEAASIAAPQSKPTPTQRSSFLDRRRSSSSRTPPRPTPPAPTQPNPPRLTGAELEKHLQEYQMEVLRKGLPPLPVQLKPENDAKLVQEGVLPPMQPQ